MIDTYNGSEPTTNHKMGIFHLNNRSTSLVVVSFKSDSGIDIYYKKSSGSTPVMEIYVKNDLEHGANIVTLLSDPSLVYPTFEFNLGDAASVDFSTLTKATIVNT